MSGITQGIESVHEHCIAKHRARVLSQHLAEFIPQGAEVLDVGCGDGELAWLVGKSRPDLTIRGVDVLVRPDTHIPVEYYDGTILPCSDDSYDVVSLIDVLHHCEDPRQVLREAARVARRAIVIKDHTREGVAAGLTLRLMDWVGNHRYGVALPYNYWRQSQWSTAFQSLGLEVETQIGRLGLYPWPASLLFDRSLHFLVRLRPTQPSSTEISADEKGLVHATV